MSLEQLEKLRTQLDEINFDILRLLNARAGVVEEIGQVKRLQGIEAFDPEREKQMLDLLVKENPGPFDDNTIRYLFKQIFQASLGLQEEQEKKPLLVSRKRRQEDTVVTIGNVRFGGGAPVVVAGPCSVENERQMELVGQGLQQQGIQVMRGGAYKPRTSPYDFQGLGEEGLKLLRKTSDRYGMLAISEIVSPSDVEMALDYVDVIQIGARNMQNFELLKVVGAVKKPVLLKRGLSATIEEFLYAAEYIMSRGNDQVILCERGIRTYEKATRNTLDISAVPILKQESHLPVLVDITHSTGRKDIMEPIARAALAVGADGIMVEVHPEPSVALSDAKQQLNIPQFETLMNALRNAKYLPSIPAVTAR
ncbi:bifunctional 3-deoxy-7-phosphoheptulonate synthase/chorismate mutase [Fodinisporobacter ferrooxydans]|uniref:Bifunctional 3-deoxy-7-phosphoheptulonate synthase/chorismate mutase n=1 Tax=Fodinisporobacter ferrooxydans TaxID=2901836 RepID=A0ABY4CM41_9BACL|nr:bifunctional 3-deoxy-7-phosphoheptulonate synthase/chorismate mutase [Alicyclobacillaceae bacterium MYW30-H2]